MTISKRNYKRFCVLIKVTPAHTTDYHIVYGKHCIHCLLVFIFSVRSVPRNFESMSATIFNVLIKMSWNNLVYYKSGILSICECELLLELYRDCHNMTTENKIALFSLINNFSVLCVEENDLFCHRSRNSLYHVNRVKKISIFLGFDQPAHKLTWNGNGKCLYGLIIDIINYFKTFPDHLSLFDFNTTYNRLLFYQSLYSSKVNLIVNKWIDWVFVLFTPILANRKDICESKRMKYDLSTVGLDPSFWVTPAPANI